jgi:membrane protein
MVFGEFCEITMPRMAPWALAIGMMVWMWMSSVVILLGAELNSEVEHQTARDSTTGRERPIGERGATMADTVGQSS